MKRLIVLLAVLAMLVPVSVMAQATPSANDSSLQSMLPSAGAFGEGWVKVDAWFDPSLTEGTNSAVAVFGGPSGDRIFIGLYDMPDTFAERAEAWETIKSTVLQNWIDAYPLPEDIENTPIISGVVKISESILPSGIGSGTGYMARSRMWGQSVAIGLFEIVDGPALLVALDGGFGGLLSLRTLAEVAATVVPSH